MVEIWGAAEETASVFPNSMVIAGVLHIFHNLAWKIDRSMNFFDSFLIGLKSLVTLLHCKQIRELFFESVSMGRCLIEATPCATPAAPALPNGGGLQS